MKAKREAKREARRDLIIERCANLFAQNRLERVSISDIEQATGLTRGAIYYYFKGKEEIWCAVLIEGLARFHTLLSETVQASEGDVRRQWLSVADAYIQHYETDRAFFDNLRRFFFSAHPEADPSEATQEEANRSVRRTVSMLTEIIIQGCDEGVFDCDDPEFAVMALWGLMVTTALMTDDDSRMSAVGRPRKTLRKSLDALLLKLVGAQP